MASSQGSSGVESSRDHRGKYVEQTSAAFGIKGVAVFRRHLLTQTFGRSVLPIPVLVVPLVGARRPGIPTCSRSSSPWKITIVAARDPGPGETAWKRIRGARKRRKKGRKRGRKEKEGEWQRVVPGIDNATGYAGEAPKLFRSFPRVNWRHVMRTDRLIPSYSRHATVLIHRLTTTSS